MLTIVRVCVCALQCTCLDPDNQEMKKTTTKPPTKCGNPDLYGNKYCNSEANNKDCAWDGGSCCARTVYGGKVDEEYCSEVGQEAPDVACDLAIAALRTFAYMRATTCREDSAC